MDEREQLRLELEALEAKLKTILVDELGDFNNGNPAIWRGTVVPAVLETKGLRCTIQPVPHGNVTPMSSGQRFADYSWVVELVNFSSDAALAIAKRKVEAAFPMKRQPNYQPPTSLKLEQCKFWIYAPKVLNPLE
ncbi:hypothetical protein IQ268_08510 [Oculatella sp. LEGE 06141]|uniref:hypothetical protein n=1 Tax=Oculatella sp. LEGE 06141 TaxID=1828648 RepID=UPI00187F16BB|nr:hypothetical protein [Oculatella sp. LEGE 06141]MBE9178599.1 hypothetical protein [Oculatella sp. LEGE 06141]